MTQEALDRGMKKKHGQNSTFNAFITVLCKMFSMTLLLVPVGVKALGVEGYVIGLVYAVIINVFTVWLLSKSERRFKNENIVISSTDDIISLSFGDPVIILYQTVKSLNSLAFVIILNMYLGAETESILCQSVKAKACGKYDHLIRVGYNLMALPLLLGGFLRR